MSISFYVTHPELEESIRLGNSRSLREGFLPHGIELIEGEYFPDCGEITVEFWDLVQVAPYAVDDLQDLFSLVKKDPRAPVSVTWS